MLAASKSSAAGSWSERLALTLVIEDEAGQQGFGEAAPLPGYSKDGLNDARLELTRLLGRRLVEPSATDSVLAALGAASQALRSPAARMALESALLDLWARRAGKPAWALLAGPGDRSTGDAPTNLELSLWLPAGPDEAMRDARAALGRGVRSFKVKVGALDSGDPGLHLLEALRDELGPGVELRADANRSARLPLDAAVRARLERLRLRYLEEPAPWVPDAGIGLPLALDESLAGRTPDLAWARRAGVVALVLKPTALGGLRRALELAHAAEREGLAPVASHTLEGPAGYAAVAAFALALGPGRLADGLAPHEGLGATRPPCLALDADRIVPWTEPGLGLTLEQALDGATVLAEERS